METKIDRKLNLAKYTKRGKTLILLGARRTGKTTLLRDYLNTLDSQNYVSYNADRIDVRDKLRPENFSNFEGEIKSLDVLAIDEAQNVPNIGLTLKLINDEYPSITVVATGSSSFDLREQIGEPLVGRKKTITLFPISVAEQMENNHQNLLPQNLIYGSYPNSITEKITKEKEDFLLELVDSMLLKDILAFKEVKSSEVIFKLLQLIAHQIGSEVSHNEIANTLGIHKDTVLRYLDLLEKCFIIFKLRAFSNNPRKEISKKPKYYFYDLGVRNALIRDFKPLTSRNDIGALWENFVIVERKKYNEYNGRNHAMYFWRNYDKQEIDLIEEYNGKLHLFECKYSKTATAKVPSGFTANYEASSFDIVNSVNYQEFLRD